MGLTFNPPPGWPVPYGFDPPPGWQPDPSWPSPPPSWPLWMGSDAPRQTYLAGATGTYVPGYLREAQGAHAAPPAAMPPGYSAPAWPQGPLGPGDVQPRPAINRLALMSFLFSLVGVVLLSVVFGIRALVKIGQQSQRGRGLAVAGLIISGVWVVVAVALIAYATITMPQRSVSSGPGSSTSHGSGLVNFFSLRTGACFKYPPHNGLIRGLTIDVAAVPCRTAHSAQIFAQFRTPGSGSYPGRKALVRRSSHDCNSVLAAKLNKSKLTPKMLIIYLFPQQPFWFVGRRTISCVVMDPARNLTTSLLKAGGAG